MLFASTGEKVKDRRTVLLMCYMIGEIKMKLLLICRSHFLRFQNLPAECASSESALMPPSLLEGYMANLAREINICTLFLTTAQLIKAQHTVHRISSSVSRHVYNSVPSSRIVYTPLRQFINWI